MELCEIKTMFDSLLNKETEQLDIPTKEEWDSLSKKLDCIFNSDFIFFIELMSKYSFPGDILNVSTRRTNGNENIGIIYDYEVNTEDWDADMIPFYGVGNGDYFCINRKESFKSPVYYFYHDYIKFEKHTNSFNEWLKKVPELLEA